MASPGDAPAPSVVRARGLVHAYREHDRERVVLDGADLDLARGELVALVGPSGSGKSTLINLLAGLDRPRAGTIELEGVCVSSMDERARTLLRRRRIGLVFQFFNLIPTLTVAENVLFPLELDGRVAPAARARALGWLARVGLADRGNSPPDRLSGGEQQRVAIARALATDPPIVLADEPTGNLDAATGADVLALLAGLAADEGKALLIATHSAEAARIAHRVLRLAGGRLVDGAPA